MIDTDNYLSHYLLIIFPSNELLNGEKKSMELNAYCQILVTNNLQNIFFCVPQKKETHTGWEQVMSE